MDPKLSASIPMAAIWMENTPTGSSVPSAVADIRESASAAHISGSGVVAAESFSVNGDEGRAYTYCPENMKYVADVALSAGVNRFVIHESASQPNDAYLPGLQLFRYGQWFHRNETWGEYAWVLMDYLGRSSALMRQGIPVADILLYYGEDSNVTSLYGGSTFASLPQVPAGYEYDFANPTVLKSYLQPTESQPLPGGAETLLESVGGTSYKVLWLDGNVRTMSLDMLLKIKEYADAGVRICGPAPERPAGLNADKKAFRRIVKDIWESGRENVYGSLNAALEGIAPDCVAEFDGVPASSEEFRYVHRSMEDGTQIYWVRNFSGKAAAARISFRDAGPHAALFNPENGKIFTLNTSQQDGRTLADLPMLSSDAFFVVFSPNPFPQPVLPSCHPEHSEGSPLLTLLGPWRVSFNQKGGDRAEEIFPDLKSWTESGNPVVKYYSGTAVYNTTFVWEPGTGAESEPIFIDLGSVKNIAEVFVNDESAGVLWKAPFRTEDISGLLRPGKNSLQIKVTNLWRNRMIGDVQPGETRPAGDSLLPSGLLGPVVITR